MRPVVAKLIRSGCVLAVVSLLAASSGCSSEPPPPAAFPVSGLVTFEGQPITGGTVTFYHSSRNGGGPIGPDGTFQVNGEGLPPAVYYVAITPPDPFATPPVPNAPPREQPKFPEIPEKYRTPIGSGIEVEVKAEPNYFVLNLERQADPEIGDEPASVPLGTGDDTADDSGVPESGEAAPPGGLPLAPPSSLRGQEDVETNLSVPTDGEN